MSYLLVFFSVDYTKTNLTSEDTAVMEMQGQTTNKTLPCTRTGPPESDDINPDFRKLSEEGYVYYNEDLVASRPNSAYFELGKNTKLFVLLLC